MLDKSELSRMRHDFLLTNGRDFASDVIHYLYDCKGRNGLLCNKSLYYVQISLLTFWEYWITDKRDFLPGCFSFSKTSNFAKNNHQNILNEQKLMTFCMLIPKRIGHCFGYFLVATTMSRADNYSCFWQMSFFPCTTCIQKRHQEKKGKKKQHRSTNWNITNSCQTSTHLY